MLSCRKVSELLSLKQEQKLRFMQEAELTFHLMICRHCKNCDQNIRSLRKIMGQFSKIDNTQKKDDTST